MNDLVPSAVVLLLGGLITGGFAGRLSRRERPLLWLALGGHVVASTALVLMTTEYYRGGDMLGYHRVGVVYAHFLQNDFLRYAPELLKFALQAPSPAIETFNFTGATGSMLAWSGFVMFFVGGESIYAGCILVGILTHAALAAIYLTFRHHIVVAHRLRVMAACVLLPSLLYWCGGLVKEAIALIGLSAMFVGLNSVVTERRYLSGVAVLSVGATLAGSVKAYVIFAFVVAALVWWLLERARPRPEDPLTLPGLRVLLVGGALAILAVSSLSTIFPRFAVENIAQEAANLQAYGYARQGEGSNYGFGDPTEMSLAGQLLFAPLGLLYSLFRPLPFEARNAAILMNVVETTALTYLFYRSASKVGLRGLIRIARREPIVGFSVVFVLVVGAGVGLTTTNLGTLSRYRTPMMPFYAAVLATVSQRGRARTRTRRGSRASVQRHPRASERNGRKSSA